MNRRLIPALLVAGLVVAAGPVAAANAASPRSANGEAPEDVKDGGTLTGYCADFDVDYVLTGKTKTITKPDGQRIITSPGQRITLSVQGGKSVSYVITGTRFERDVVVKGKKITEYEVKGRNILLNLQEGTETPGLFLVTGNFDYALDADFVEVRGFNPEGKGKVTDICKALS